MNPSPFYDERASVDGLRSFDRRDSNLTLLELRLLTMDVANYWI
jgi:hypothetical protein